MKSQPTLFEPIPSRVDPISLEHFGHVREDLQQREARVLRNLYAYLAQTGFPDATGGELAIFMGLKEIHIRPRLTGLKDKALLERGPVRPSRAPGEGKCRPYRPTMSREAWERGQK